jgi:hypothetical protein
MNANRTPCVGEPTQTTTTTHGDKTLRGDERTMRSDDLPVFGPSRGEALGHGRRRIRLFAILASCILPVPLLYGQATGDAATNIPVLVVIEDEDETSVRRSSDMFKRVVAELRRAMQFRGFQMLDEESLFADFGIVHIPDRRTKSELVTDIKSILLSDEARHQIRAWVLFRVHAAVERPQRGAFATIHTRLDGELYDARTNLFLDAFEEIVTTKTSPDCARTTLCIEEHVGEKAREVAMALGNVLARMLERYSPPVAARPPTGRSQPGMPVAYTVRFEYFEQREVVTIVGVMAEEFPGARNVDKVVDRGSALKVYAYQTTASAAKLEEWLSILLDDMGFDIDDDILFRLDGVNITLTKIVPTPDRRPSVDERRRFN